MLSISARKYTPTNIGFILQMELFRMAFVWAAALLLRDGIRTIDNKRIALPKTLQLIRSQALHMYLWKI